MKRLAQKGYAPDILLLARHISIVKLRLYWTWHSHTACSVIAILYVLFCRLGCKDMYVDYICVDVSVSDLLSLLMDCGTTMTLAFKKWKCYAQINQVINNWPITELLFMFRSHVEYHDEHCVRSKPRYWQHWQKGINDIFLHFVASNAQNWLISLHVKHVSQHLEVGTMGFYWRIKFFLLGGDVFTPLFVSSSELVSLLVCFMLIIQCPFFPLKSVLMLEIGFCLALYCMCALELTVCL